MASEQGATQRQQRGSAEPIEGRCGARLQRTDPPRYCKRRPRANGRCKFHGGTMPTGPEHPRFRHGNRSAYPKRLAERIARLRNDVEFLSLQQRIAEIRARREELFEELAGADSASMRLGQAMDVMARLGAIKRGSGKVANMLPLLDELETILSPDSNTDERMVWREILDLDDQERKLVATERRVREASEGTVTMEFHFRSLERLNTSWVAAWRECGAPPALVERAQEVYRNLVPDNSNDMLN